MQGATSEPASRGRGRRTYPASILVKTPSRPKVSRPKRPRVRNADGSRTSDVLLKRPKPFQDGSKNDELAYGRSDLDAWTDRKPKTARCTRICQEYSRLRYWKRAGRRRHRRRERRGRERDRRRQRLRHLDHARGSTATPARRDGLPRHYFARVRHPAIKSGPHDDLDDFAPNPEHLFAK